jgi:serine/threonine-protein kinase
MVLFVIFPNACSCAGDFSRMIFPSMMKPLALLKSNLAKKIYVFIGILFIAVMVCDRVVMPWYVYKAATLVVPKVINLKFEEGSLRLTKLGLEPKQGEIRFDNRYPQGTVIAQNPLPGRKVREGRRVYLTVSGGEQLVEVPPLRGRSFRDAKIALEQRGLALGNTVYETSNDFPEGTVISQEIEARAKVRQGARISVVLSEGEGTGRVLVPDIIGKSLTDGERVLAQKSLRVGKVNYQPSSQLLPNTVVAQYPKGGDLVNEGQEIDLFVVQVTDKKLPIIPEN